MAQFTDSQNRVWQIKLTGPVLQRVKDSMQVELSNLETDPMLKLRNDPLILQMAVYLLCQSQVEKVGISPDDFADSLPTPPDAMIEAVEAAIVNFFPSTKHTHVREVLSKYSEMTAKTDEIARAKMARIIADPKSLERIGRKADQEIEAEMKRIFGPDTTPIEASI